MDVQTPERRRAAEKIKKRYGTSNNRKQIDWNIVKNLCKIHCTQEEIAAVIEVSVDTLVAHCKEELKEKFSEFYKREMLGGNVSLRRAMFKNAVELNDTHMQKWLSKQHLNMQEKFEVTNTYEPLIIEFESGKKTEIRVSENKSDE